jgi:pentatricopeptide repeat protein
MLSPARAFTFTRGSVRALTGTSHQPVTIGARYNFFKDVSENILNDRAHGGMDIQQLLIGWVQLMPNLYDLEESHLIRDAATYTDLVARKVMTDISNSPNVPSDERSIRITTDVKEMIRTWTRLEDAQKAESLLECLLETFAEVKHPEVTAELDFACASVISAWSKDKADSNSLARALYWFDKRDNVPTIGYNSLLNAYANKGMAIEAIDFFRNMQTNRKAEPDAVTFSTVMKALVISNRRDVQENVDKLLEELKETYEAQGCPPKLEPNAVIYGTVMTRAPPERATALLRELQAWYERTGKMDQEPTARHYMLAMRSCARAGRSRETEQLFLELLKGFQAGNEKLLPTYQVSPDTRSA